MKRSNIFDEQTGLINQFRLLQSSPNILVFALLNKSTNSASKIRRYWARTFWNEFHNYSLKSQVKILIYFIIWPLFWARYVMNNIGIEPYAYVKRTEKKSIIKQFAEQLYLAFFYSLSVNDYYMYRIYKSEHRKDIDKYLLRLTFKQLIYVLLDNVYIKKNKAPFINNQDSKSYFDEMCRKHQLNVVPILAHINGDEIKYFVEKEKIAEYDELFIKPERSRGGNDAEIWTKHDNGYINSIGNKYTFDEILNYYSTKEENYFSSSDYIIQPRLRNHEKIDFGVKALSTVRLNTLLIDDSIYVLFGVLRFSVNTTSNVDNFHAGGFASPIVDLQSGILGKASRMDIREPGLEISVHPINGKVIDGLSLPYWDEVLILAKKAHAIFNNRVLIGWDIAITDNGPLLIESNGWPDMDIIQTSYNRSLSDFPYFELLAEKIENDFHYYYSTKI